MKSERLTYTDHSKTINTLPLKVDVAMIQVRDESHAWVRQAMESVSVQSYPNVGSLTFQNKDRMVKIGKAWNTIVQESDADLILFMGDDDILNMDLVQSLVDHFVHLREMQPNVVHITSFCTLLDDQSGRVAYHQVNHTGMYLRKFLIDHPFDEEIEINVGEHQLRTIAQVSRMSGQPMTVGITHNFGYVFRQHPFMNPGFQRFQVNG
jgi:HrpA-like RNA helicase